MQNMKLLLGVIIGTLVLVFGVAFLFSQEEAPRPPADPAMVVGSARNLKTGTGEAISETAEATESGEQNPPTITLVEFSDFECPACKATQPLISQVMSEYGNDVMLVYRHFPLETIHPNAKRAAIASEIMAEQDLFWEYHDLLFERQEEWAEESNPVAKFKEYAEELGGNVDNFETLMEASEYVEPVESDIRDGFALGVNSTPTFYVDGEKVSVQDLARVIESKL
jgi:protein-disulfide isomerase